MLTLPHIFPPHVVAPKKDKVTCIGDYTLKEGSGRANENVITKTMLTLDVDKEVSSTEEFAQQQDKLKTASARLAAANIQHLYYSSYSHGRPKEGPLPYFGYRLVIPFATPMTTDEFINLSKDFKALAKKVVGFYDLPGNIMALSQPWYVPSCPDETTRVQADYHFHDGALFDWRQVSFFRSAPELPVVVPDYSDAPYSPVTPEQIEERLRKLNLPVLSYVLTRTVPPLGSVKSRHNDILLPVTCAIARISRPGESFEDLFRVLEPWLNIMEEASPRSGAGWRGEARRALEGALRKAPEWRARAEAEDKAFLDELEAKAKAWTKAINS